MWLYSPDYFIPLLFGGLPLGISSSFIFPLTPHPSLSSSLGLPLSPFPLTPHLSLPSSLFHPLSPHISPLSPLPLLSHPFPSPPPSPLHSHSTDHTYEGLIEKQPIGRCLFEEFCSEDPILAKCHEFIKEVDEFVLVAEEKGAVTARKIYEDFLAPQVCLKIVSVSSLLVLLSVVFQN